MSVLTPYNIFKSTLTDGEPAAEAMITGNSDHPNLYGHACFYYTPINGILVGIEVFGLPDNDNHSHFYGLHIHEFGNCTKPFDKTGSHFNPQNQPHPYHAGDMPPLLSSDGYAFTIFYDNRLKISDIIGKSIIIHSMRDDFTTQPSGDAGQKIGCGIITKSP